MWRFVCADAPVKIAFSGNKLTNEIYIFFFWLVYCGTHTHTHINNTDSDGTKRSSTLSTKDRRRWRAKKKNVQKREWLCSMQLTPDAKWPQNVLFISAVWNRQHLTQLHLNLCSRAVRACAVCSHTITITKYPNLKPVELWFFSRNGIGCYRCSRICGSFTWCPESSAVIILAFQHDDVSTVH